MSGNANPNVDPASYGSLKAAIEFGFNSMMQNVNGRLPAQVIDFDRDAKTVDVQPLIMMLDTNGVASSRAIIYGIRVEELGGDNCVLSFNLVPGDLGWIKASDNDVSLFLQTFAESPPNTLRTKNFADAVFVPNILNGWTLNEEDATNAVFQTRDGTVRLSIFPTKIKITAPDGLEIDGDLLVDGGLTVNGGLTISGGTGPNTGVINGDFLVNGNIGATGTITPGV